MKTKYPVYSAFEHGYLSFVLCFIPCFCLYLAYATGFAFLYIVAVITVFIAIPVILALSASVTFLKEGIIARTGFNRKISMNWDSICCCGIFSIRTLGAVHSQRYIYFSREPVCLRDLEKSQVLPKETKDFVFLSYNKEVYETVRQLWDSNEVKFIR